MVQSWNIASNKTEKEQNVPHYKFMRKGVKEIVYRIKYDYFNDHLNCHKQTPKLQWKSIFELSGLDSDTLSEWCKWKFDIWSCYYC